MGESGQKSSKFGHIDAQTLGARIALFLKRKYPHKTHECVADDLDISASTVRKWLDRSSVPSVIHFGLLLYAYEAEFVASVFPGLSFVETAILLGRRDAAKRQIAEAQAELDALSGGRPS